MQIHRQIGDAGIIVDAGRRNLAAVAAVDRLHPFHADDRIQTQFGERTAHIDIAGRHEQRVGQTVAQILLKCFERDHLHGSRSRDRWRRHRRSDARDRHSGSNRRSGDELRVQIRRQIGDAGIIVDASRRNLAAVAAVDRLHPFHADDRIQTQFGKRTAHIDIAGRHEQRVGQTVAQILLKHFESDHLSGCGHCNAGRDRQGHDRRNGNQHRGRFTCCVDARLRGIDPQPTYLCAYRAFTIAQIDIDAVRIAQPRPGKQRPGTGCEREHGVDSGRHQRRSGRSGLGDQRDSDLQGGFERARMQVESGEIVDDGRRHAYFGQPLACIRL